MARRKREDVVPTTRRPPARTPEDRERHLMGLAHDLAEKQMLAGTASATVIIHYLKLNTEKEKLERIKLEKEAKLLQARVEAQDSMQRLQDLYSNAVNAMRSYSGVGLEEDDDEDDY